MNIVSLLCCQRHHAFSSNSNGAACIPFACNCRLAVSSKSIASTSAIRAVVPWACAVIFTYDLVVSSFTEYCHIVGGNSAVVVVIKDTLLSCVVLTTHGPIK